MLDTFTARVRWAGAVRTPSGRIDALEANTPLGVLDLEAPHLPAIYARWLEPEAAPARHGLKVYGVGVFGVLDREPARVTSFWDSFTLPAGELVRLVNQLAARGWFAEGPGDLAEALNHVRRLVAFERQSCPRVPDEAFGINPAPHVVSDR